MPNGREGGEGKPLACPVRGAYLAGERCGQQPRELTAVLALLRGTDGGSDGGRYQPGDCSNRRCRNTSDRSCRAVAFRRKDSATHQRDSTQPTENKHTHKPSSYIHITSVLGFVDQKTPMKSPLP